MHRTRAKAYGGVQAFVIGLFVATQGLAQAFDPLPSIAPPVSPERGVAPSDVPLTDEGPTDAPAVEAAPQEARPDLPLPVVALPRFHDPRIRRPRPDLSATRRLRFLTVRDFEPFSALDEQGRLTGFQIEVIRALCDVLDIVPRCQVQVLPWNQLSGALARGDGEAIVAGVNVTQDARETLGFTEPYMLFPARFVARDGTEFDPSAPRETVAVVSGSAHEAMLKALFPQVKYRPLPSAEEVRKALSSGTSSVAFADGATTAYWLAGDEGACCRFVGAPYLSEHFLGSGLTIAVRADEVDLRDSLDWGLAELSRSGRLDEIYLRSFPVGFF